jgi:hypothetical protein
VLDAATSQVHMQEAVAAAPAAVQVIGRHQAMLAPIALQLYTKSFDMLVFVVAALHGVAGRHCPRVEL